MIYKRILQILPLCLLIIGSTLYGLLSGDVELQKTALKAFILFLIGGCLALFAQGIFNWND